MESEIKGFIIEMLTAVNDLDLLDLIYKILLESI